MRILRTIAILLLAGACSAIAQHPSPLTPEQKALNDRLQKVAREGDLEAIKEVLAQGADPNCRNSGGFTAVTRAAAGNNLEAVKLVVEAGGNIDEFNRNLTRPIGWAVLNQNHEMLQYFLEQGCRLNFYSNKTTKGVARGPIHTAVNNGDLQSVKMLFEYGNLPDNRSSHGDSALRIALGKTSIDDEIVDYLIATKPNADLPCAHLIYPLTNCISRGRYDVFERLVKELGATHIGYRWSEQYFREQSNSWRLRYRLHPYLDLHYADPVSGNQRSPNYNDKAASIFRRAYPQGLPSVAGQVVGID